MDTVSVTSEMDHYQQSFDRPAQVSDRSSSKKTMLKSIIALIVFVILTAAFAYFIVNRFPNTVRNMLIALDRFGISDVGEKEQTRVRAIMRLPVTYEEKQVLVNRTVFFGATEQMVQLALGEPVCTAQKTEGEGGPLTNLWVYYIEIDHKPTILRFQSNQLVSASKGSVLDVCK